VWSKIAGVIFDLDGVLVCTDELHLRSWERLAREESLFFNEAIYSKRMRGAGRMACLATLLGQSPGGGSEAYTSAEKEALAERKNRYYQGLARTLTSDDATPGVRRMLTELRQRGIKTAIGSSSRNALLILERVGLSGLFEATVDGNDIARSKPDPQVFLLAAKRLGLSPSECLVVEDAPLGIEAARRAHMAVFGIGTAESLVGVKCLAPSLSQVTVDDLLAAGNCDQTSLPP